ncbi:MAG: agmatinase [Candidatus Woesearchaeota archaeon]
MKFMNLPEEYSGPNSRFLIVPIPYEGRVSWMSGASKAPANIIRASANLEYYDEEFEVEPFLKGIATLKSITPGRVSEEAAVRSIERKVAQLKIEGSFPVFLGGDHSVTIGVVKGLEKKFFDFGFISIDAHSDLRESWNKSRFNHACTSRRVLENHPVLIVGLRSQDSEEAEIIREGRALAIKRYEYSPQFLKSALAKLPQSVFLSIDVDAFDPSLVRYTGTPEPGGFFWNELIEILKLIFEHKKVIAADVVEFAPGKDEKITNAESFTIAKLIYKIFALKMLSEKWKA